MTNILADKGICLTPGFFQDYTNEFVRIPFECEEKFECYLYIRLNDKIEQLKDFIKILKDIYKDLQIKLLSRFQKVFCFECSAVILINKFLYFT